METSSSAESLLSLQVCKDEVSKFNMELRDDQVSILDALCQKKDALCVLPTGSGKSLIFIAMVLGMKKVYRADNFIGIVVSPLVSLNKNHVSTFDKYGLKYLDLNGSQQSIDNDDVPDIIVTNPEMLKEKRKELKKLSHIKNVLFVVDEAHTILSWGKEFRKTFADLDYAINSFKTKPTVLTLTATLTTLNKHQLLEQLGFQEENIFQLVRNPVLPNMTFVRLEDNFSESHARVLAKLLKAKEAEAPKCLVFTYSTNETIDIKDMIWEETEPALRKHINWCTAVNTQELRNDVVDSLLSSTSDTRIMITTSLLSMGVDMKGVKYVIITRMTNDIEELLQRAGRSGRDGEDCVCIIFVKRKNSTSSSFAETFRLNRCHCCRVLLNRVFMGPSSPYSGADVCCSNCSTNFKDEITRALTEASICSTPAAKLFAIDHKKRIMTTDDKTSLTKTLEEERQAMIEGTLNVAIAPCPLTNGLIRAIVDNSRYLFSISDVEKIVSHKKTAAAVLQILSEEMGDIEENMEMG